VPPTRHPCTHLARVVHRKAGQPTQEKHILDDPPEAVKAREEVVLVIVLINVWAVFSVGAAPSHPVPGKRWKDDLLGISGSADKREACPDGLSEHLRRGQFHGPLDVVDPVEGPCWDDAVLIQRIERSTV
jgi:hypothetical protein